MFEVKLSSQATKFLRGQDQHISGRIKTALRKLEDDPFKYVEHFEGDCFKFRIGGYRALVDIDKQSRIVWVRVLDKRERIYT